MKLKTALSLALKKPPRTSDEFEKLPKHVAIIMDGNGRWAKKHKLNVSRGHRQGTETLREIIRHTDDLGIGALSLYAFSTENWNRSEEEVAALMQLILDFFASEIDELDAKNVRILILGDKSGLPEKQRETLKEAERRTEKNTGLRLNIAVNYGGRAELVKAAREIATLAVAPGYAQLVLPGPSSVSVHDDRHVLRQFVKLVGCPGRFFQRQFQRRFPRFQLHGCFLSP